MKLFKLLAAAAIAMMMATGALASTKYDKPGFVTELEDGRLWVFEKDSKDFADFKKHGEPVKQFARIKAGPDGMTIKSSKMETIDAYLKAK